jgi:membrane protein DedA with SNARE-associated domain
VFVIASLTDPIVEFATNVVADLGLPGVFMLMLLESACIPIPSEATMLFAGFNVSEGHYSLLVLTLVGVFANLVGSWIAYGVGYFGRVDLIEKHGHLLFIKPHHLHAADRWFQRHGDATVFFTRMIPVIRTFISLPAGAARMPFWRFSALTVLGCLPWVFALAFVGDQVGRRWTEWRDSLHYVDYAVLAFVVVGVGILVVRHVRKGGDEAPVKPAADAGAS